MGIHRVQTGWDDVRPSVTQSDFLVDKDAGPEFRVRNRNAARLLDLMAAHDCVREH